MGIRGGLSRSTIRRVEWVVPDFGIEEIDTGAVVTGETDRSSRHSSITAVVGITVRMPRALQSGATIDKTKSNPSSDTLASVDWVSLTWVT